MNKTEIRHILNAHKEHFRVLPTRTMNALQGITDALNADAERVLSALTEIKEKPVDLGNRTSKDTKKSKRPKR